MKNLIIIFLSLICYTTVVKADKVSFLEFERGIYERARIKAAEEGKLLFIDFYAKWCTPCKWMDETTYVDPNVVKVLDEKYVSIKVDIDEMEGFELKSKFDIRYLPTMLIFNSEGKMVERIEETLSPEKMKTILDSHSPSAPQDIVKHDFNMSPHDVSGALLQSPSSDLEDEMSISKEEYEKYVAGKSESYKMQMGVFRNFEGAMQQVNQLRKRFLEEIEIVEDARGDDLLYKVIMGDFKSRASAVEFQLLLKEKYDLDSVLY